ncbi:hypothetical protein SteCoe_18871 [Stentor coeruleus]|uniref:Transmembrane protein n=1 Tax=Stentor coeruleus TaxID=5963 RepID=A0A1R2BW49_9CILI|nr:hypothetical protein SteCoe_18871 [Stentor coeruleus]
MELTLGQKQLVWDYIFFHYHSPLNTNPEDYRKFNLLMFRAIKLNFIYTAGFGGLSYYLCSKMTQAWLKNVSKPGYIALIISVYSTIQYTRRMKNIIYSEDALKCAVKYEQEVYRYNDHFKRLYGNR